MIYFRRKSQAACLAEAPPKFTTTAHREFRDSISGRAQVSSNIEVSFFIRKSISSKTSIVPSSRGAAMAMLEWKWMLEAKTSRER